MVVISRGTPVASYNVGNALMTVSRPAYAQPGDILIVTLTWAQNNAASVVAPTGWTLVTPIAYNTRSTAIFVRKYLAGDATDTTFTLPTATTCTALYGVLIGDAVQGIETFTRSSWWLRTNNGGSQTLIRALSVTSDGPSYALTVMGEASTAGDINTALGSLTGTTLWGVAPETSGHINVVLYGLEELAAATASGDSTFTADATSANGAGVQLLIPLAAAPVADTDRVAYVASPHFTHNSLRVGLKSLVTTDTISVSNGSTSVTATVDSSTGWGYADFTGLTANSQYTFTISANGVLQTDVGLTAKTMPVGPSTFTFVAGSCQFTASSHPVFTRMKEDDPLFIAHMGDLHYQNATTEEAWRAGVDASLEAASFRDMLSSVPLDWQWDNHDRIIIDTLNLGQTDPATLTKWRTFAGASGWGTTDSNCRTWVAGRVRFISTDHWTNRDDPDLVAAATRKMWTTDQENWWYSTLESATEPVIVWFSQWTNQNNANGRWDSFQTQTSRLESWLNARPGIKRRLVMIGGDSHSLQADSGMRASSHEFVGVPSLNISGFNRAATNVDGTSNPTWDIACRTIYNDPATETEAKWGSYSRVTVTDDGTNIEFKWEGVRVDNLNVVDILAEYTMDIGTVVVDGEDCIVTVWDAAQNRERHGKIEFAN